MDTYGTVTRVNVFCSHLLYQSGSIFNISYLYVVCIDSLVDTHIHTIQYNTIQYNTIQYNTIQYNTIQYNTIHSYIHTHADNIYFTIRHFAWTYYSAMVPCLVAFLCKTCRHRTRIATPKQPRTRRKYGITTGH